MNEKTIKLWFNKELLADLDKLFPEKTPEDKHGMKEIYFRIGQEVLFASYINKKRTR